MQPNETVKDNIRASVENSTKRPKRVLLKVLMYGLGIFCYQGALSAAASVCFVVSNDARGLL
jgi:hypothetical protein